MIILDTHVWIWLVSDSPELSTSTRNKLAHADSLGVSVISCWEVAMLIAKRRLAFTMDVQDWIDAALKHPKVRLLAIDPKISVLSTRLPGEFHEDPADRIIVASCLNHKSPLATKDVRIRDWGFVNIVW